MIVCFSGIFYSHVCDEIVIIADKPYILQKEHLKEHYMTEVKNRKRKYHFCVYCEPFVIMRFYM